MQMTNEEKLAFFQDLKAKGFTAEHAKQYIHAYKDALKSGQVPADQKDQVVATVKLLVEYVDWLSKN